MYSLNAFGILDLVFCSVSDEDGLATPLDNDVLAEWDCREVDFDFGLGEHVGGRSHVDEEICGCVISGVLAIGPSFDRSGVLSGA